MSAEIQWDDDQKTTLVVWYANPPDVNDVVEAIDTTASFLDSVDHPVCVIVDMLAGLDMPRNWVAYRPLFAGARGTNHPNLALNVFVIVKDNTPLQLTVGIIAKPHDSHKIAYSMAEARQIVANHQARKAVRTA